MLSAISSQRSAPHGHVWSQMHEACIWQSHSELISTDAAHPHAAPSAVHTGALELDSLCCCCCCRGESCS